MRVRFFAAVVGLALSFAAPPAEAAQAGVSEQDRIYANRAHQSNLFEVITGDLAGGKGICGRVRELGPRFSGHHVMLDADLIGVSARNAIPLNDVLDPEQTGWLAELTTRWGRDFDVAWLRDQADAHVHALELGALELRYGWNPEVKGLAAAAEPVLEAHLRETTAAAAECLPGS